MLIIGKERGDMRMQCPKCGAMICPECNSEMEKFGVNEGREYKYCCNDEKCIEKNGRLIIEGDRITSGKIKN